MELPTAAALEESGSSLVRPGDFVLQIQKLDSIAGSYTADGVRFPVIGEVRRDQRIALVAFAPDDQSRYAAGEVRNDTLWVELTSFAAAESWPVGTRAAWVKGTPAAPFLRLPGVPTAPPAADTLALPPAESAAVPGIPVETTPAPAAPTPTPTPAGPPARAPIGVPVEQPTPPAPRPTPQPESTGVSAPPTQRPPRVLGVPVQPQPTEPRPTEPRPGTSRPATPRPVPPDTIATPPSPEPGTR